MILRLHSQEEHLNFQVIANELGPGGDHGDVDDNWRGTDHFCSKRYFGDRRS
jgi:hypothetical protein